MLTAFDHAVIAVEDLTRATERFEALLGRPASWRGVHPDAGTANTLFRLENCYLELLSPHGDGPLGAQVQATLASRGEGMLALAFGTADVAAAAAALRERGVEVGSPASGEGRGTPARNVERDTDRPDAVRRWSSVLLPPPSTRGIPVLVLEHESAPELLPATRPFDPAGAAVVALDHAVVISDDPSASAAFYGDVLGLRLALDRDFPKRGVRLIFFRVGGVTVEVAGPIETKENSDGQDRFGGLSYRVDDVDAIRARLLAANFDVSEVRDGNKPGTRVCTVRSGTCGVPTLLLQPAPRSRLPADRLGE
jgi:catechol 2,3-dioxygenase-like lactoylglutathione lyase family enzyme